MSFYWTNGINGEMKEKKLKKHWKENEKTAKKNIITLVQVSCKETLLYYEMRPQNTIVLPKYYYSLVVEVTKTWEF
jgi:hypothetical protein